MIKNKCITNAASFCERRHLAGDPPIVEHLMLCFVICGLSWYEGSQLSAIDAHELFEFEVPCFENGQSASSPWQRFRMGPPRLTPAKGAAVGDLIFSKVKAKGERKIPFAVFRFACFTPASLHFTTFLCCVAFFKHSG